MFACEFVFEILWYLGIVGVLKYLELSILRVSIFFGWMIDRLVSERFTFVGIRSGLIFSLAVPTLF
jgi:hypothetical protein